MFQIFSLLFIVMILPLSISCTPKWKLAGSLDGITFFYDKQRIARSGNDVRLWVKMEPNAEHKKELVHDIINHGTDEIPAYDLAQISHVEALILIDCTKETFTMYELGIYSLAHSLAHDKLKTISTEEIVWGTPIRQIKKEVCQ